MTIGECADVAHVAFAVVVFQVVSKRVYYSGDVFRRTGVKTPCLNIARIFSYSIAISVLMLANASFSVRAQEATSGWQTLSPEGEEFAILMPKHPKFQESRVILTIAT